MPYRVEHFEHLELQWTCFIPLSFWAVHKAFDQLSFVYGLLAGVLVWLQLIACVYYGVFLGLVVPPLRLSGRGAACSGARVDLCVRGTRGARRVQHASVASEVGRAAAADGGERGGNRRLVYRVRIGADALQPAARTPPLYRFLRQLPQGVVAEFPMPPSAEGSGYNTLYMFSSISHWYPLVNGYSGFIPEHYRQTMSLMSGFPDGVSLKRLGK